MTGVEILAVEKVATEFGFCWPGFIALLLTGIIFGLVIYSGANNTPATIFIVVFALATAFFVGFTANGKPIAYEPHYKVIISDEVSMNEFLERYEIISQEGKIYTVRERETIEDGKWRIDYLEE